MNTPPCKLTIPAQTIAAYWLGELDDGLEAEFEEHLFACEGCTVLLDALARLSEGIRRVTREGNVSAILPAPFVRRLRDVGLRVREYRLQAGGSVACTIAPEDDLVLAHLHAPLQDVERLDVVFHDVSANSRTRVEDVAFDPTAGEVVMTPPAVGLARHPEGRDQNLNRRPPSAEWIRAPLGRKVFSPAALKRRMLPSK